jgi:hypothetical protein
MRKAYITKRFQTSSLELIDQANEICEEYMADGLNLTLRQLYYQFVARDLFENLQRNYDRLGAIVSEARLAGLIDWDAIVDRTRFLESQPHWSSVSSILWSAAAGYNRDLWATQLNRVEVWIEKQALTGIIERPCTDLDVPFFACRGYVSQSEQREAGLRALRNWRDHDQGTVILHLGDHDPSGIDMTRDNDTRLAMFAEGSNCVTVERIALNMDQIQLYDPPPNPTKLTDSRAGGYVSEHGYDSWELDALEPKVLDQLIRDRIASHMDENLMAEAKALQSEHRSRLRDIASEQEDLE